MPLALDAAAGCNSIPRWTPLAARRLPNHPRHHSPLAQPPPTLLAARPAAPTPFARSPPTLLALDTARLVAPDTARPLTPKHIRCLPLGTPFNILKKFDGETITEVVRLRPYLARMRYRVKRLPRYLILHMRRFTKNNFFVEKNPTLELGIEGLHSITRTRR